MSYSFYLETVVAPDFHKTIDCVGAIESGAKIVEGYDLSCDEMDDIPNRGEPFPDGFFFHFYVWGISTRSIEVGFENGSMQIRIMTCSCAEDFRIGIAFVKALAEEYNCEIRPEDREPLMWATFESEFEGWIEAMVESGATFLPAMAKDGSIELPLTLPGPCRPFHIGKRVLAELGDASDAGFSERLFEKIRSVRYVDPDEHYYHANTIQLKESSGGSTIAVWAPGVDYLFPKVDFLAIMADEMLYVPYDVAEKLASSVKFIDECQMLVDAVDENNWDNFLVKAREYAVSIGDDLPPKPETTNGFNPTNGSQGKWWQFWK